MFISEWFFNLTILGQVLIIYLVVINITTFFYFGLDKMKANMAHRRISEKKLWILSLIGGSLGGLLGMYFFRHKTKKLSFQAIFALILAIQTWLVIWFFVNG